MGVRATVPALMLRLDLDQECYDFFKWWETCDADGRYDWGDMTIPHLNIHGADIFEGAHFFGQFSALNNLVAILLLKLKLLVDIRNLKSVEFSVIRSPLSLKLQKKSPESLLEIEKKLLNKTRQIGATLVKVNSNFMFCLLDPDETLFEPPSSYSVGPWKEMALAIQDSYAAWWETKGVLDLLNDARACAARDSEDEIEDMVEAEAGSSVSRTAEEIMEDVSVDRIWRYLDWAVENASYLGPWSKRPSEQHTRENKEAWAQAMAEEAEFDNSLDKGAGSDED